MKVTLTHEQKICLTWLELMKPKLKNSVYKQAKSCIRHNKRVAVRNMSDFEKECLQVFTKDRNHDFILECISIQEKIKGIYDGIKS